MSEAERFNYVGEDAEMITESDGEFVRYSDYKQLQSRLAQVEKELAEEKRLRSELKQIAQIGIEEVSSVGSALQANAVRDATDLAATRMRERCVARVKEMRDKWQQQHSPSPYEHTSGEQYKISGADQIITALESLTLDGEKEQ